MTVSVFSAMGIWNFFGWLILGFACFIVVMIPVGLLVPVDDATFETLFGIFLTVFPLLWIYGKLQGRISHLRSFFRKPAKLPLRDKLRILACLLLTMALSIWTGSLFSLLIPGYRESMELKTFFNAADTLYPFLNNIITALLFVVIGPLIEEIFFRGAILHRWTHKWDLRTAVLCSSALFAILHLEPFGSFLFGVLMCLLYMRTGSLVIPVFLHILNNAIITPLMLPEMYAGYEHVLTTPEEEWEAVVFLSFVIPLLAVPSLQFMRRNWHMLRLNTSLPPA